MARSSPNVVPFPQLAAPNIELILDRFLEDQARRLKSPTLRQYRRVVELLRVYLDGYGCQSLDTEEAAFFKWHFESEGSRNRGFCQLFGADKITENLGGFLCEFMIRKVIAGPRLKRYAGTVSKKLARWLELRGLVDAAAAQQAAEQGADAARDVPRAERAAMLLVDHAAGLNADDDAPDDEEYVEFDSCTVVKVEPGRVWLSSWREEKSYGPVQIPEEVSRLLEIGWDITCSLARNRGRWQIIQVANVYPTDRTPLSGHQP